MGDCGTHINKHHTNIAIKGVKGNEQIQFSNHSAPTVRLPHVQGSQSAACIRNLLCIKCKYVMFLSNQKSDDNDGYFS